MDDDTLLSRLARTGRLARALGPLAARGVLQYFHVGPVLDLAPSTLRAVAGTLRAWARDARAGRAGDVLHLYVHVPFCSHRCRYCTYYSLGGAAPAVVDAYLERLDRELPFWAEALEGLPVSTLYLGGGTPTVLEPARLDALLGTLRSTFRFRPGGERAFECNPLTLTPEKADLFAAHGFNRASFGVQTLDPAVLEAMNRGYQTRGRVEATLRTLLARRFRVNLDLIHGFEGTGLASTLASLREVLALGPAEVTVYGLSPYTPGPARPAAPVAIGPLAEAIRPLAADHGYGARPSDTAVLVHRSAPGDDRLTAEVRDAGRGFFYCDVPGDDASVLGIGPGTFSRIAGRLAARVEAFDPAEAFDPDAPVVRARALGPLEEQRRFVAWQFARCGGLDPAAYAARFGTPLRADFGGEVDGLLARGRLAWVGGVLRAAGEDPFERFATEAVFVDDASIDAALRVVEARPRVPDGGRVIEVEAGGVSVAAVVAEAGPELRLAHVAGRFGFLVPSEAEGYACAETRALVRVLARLFDAVVAADRPATPADLARALVARGDGRALSRRADGGRLVLRVREGSLESGGGD